MTEESPEREVRPWDLLNPNNYSNDKTEVERRMEICLGCEFLRYPGRICAKCKCAMNFKTKLESAHCPIHKW